LKFLKSSGALFPSFSRKDPGKLIENKYCKLKENKSCILPLLAQFVDDENPPVRDFVHEPGVRWQNGGQLLLASLVFRVFRALQPEQQYGAQICKKIEFETYFILLLQRNQTIKIKFMQ